MLLRYSGSTAAGTVVTAALIYGMQLMIVEGDFSPPPAKPVRLVSPIAEAPPPPPRRTRVLPDPPAPRVGPPGIEPPREILPTEPLGPIVPVTPPGYVGPPGRQGGRQGPWAADSDLVLVARVEPPYPHAALRRELEGTVTVEFTVTKRGTADAIRIIESTDAIFERAAIDAASRFRYRPRIVDGVAVDVPGVRTEIRFVLGD